MEKYNVDCVKENECVGCKACALICPANAICMKKNEEGFEYPVVSEKLCIRCGKCTVFCPALQKLETGKSISNNIYAARSMDQDILLKSSSGGIFGVLAAYCIGQKGVVYGVAFSEDFHVEYTRGETYTDVCRMRGSKYVDAFISEDLIKVFLNDVSSRKKILFSATSCQSAGMKALCRERGIDDHNVAWVDFYKCSGKVSPFLWEEQCKLYRKKGMLQEVSFRDKTNGWKTFSMYQRISGKCYHTDFLLSGWNKFLGGNFSRRKPCLDCRYSGGKSGADISIGDFWNRVSLPKKWKDNKGLSIVQINTDKGAEWFHDVLDDLDCMEMQFSDNLKIHNECLVDFEGRKKFWDVFHKQGYDELCSQYAKITWKERILFGKIRPLLVKMGIR